MDESTLSAFTPLSRGNVPLLFQLPDGTKRQLDVPHNASVAEIKRKLTADISEYAATRRGRTSPPLTSTSLPSAIQAVTTTETETAAAPTTATEVEGLTSSAGSATDMNPNSFDLFFNDTPLDPSSTIEQYHIPETYEQAGSLLRMISSSALPSERRPGALESANAVVHSVSKGVKDMTKLIDAAAATMNAGNSKSTGSASPDGVPGTGNTNRTTAGNADVSMAIDVSDGPITAAAVATSLSQRLPDLFPLDGTLFGGGSGVDIAPSTDPLGEQPQGDASLKRKRSSLILQPSLKRIREIRRQQSNRSGKSGTSGVEIWRTSGSTWMDDVTKTFEVDALRRSGVLEKTEEGASVAQYLKKLEDDDDANEDDPRVGDSSLAADECNGGSSSDGEEVHDGTSVENDVQEVAPTGNASFGASRPHSANAVNSAKSCLDASGDVLTKRMSDLKVGATASSLITSAPASAPAARVATPTTPSTTPLSSLSPGSAARSKAVPIAPAPAGLSRMVGPPRGVMETSTPAKPKKKRGRKRKHPELTEEERKLARQEQNRRSAKLSRVRRKIIAAEYEEKMTKLITENSSLKEEVQSLSQKLNYMQSLLTLSVTPTPIVGGHSPRSAQMQQQQARSPFLGGQTMPQVSHAMTHRQSLMQRNLSPGVAGITSPVPGWKPGL